MIDESGRLSFVAVSSANGGAGDADALGARRGPGAGAASALVDVGTGLGRVQVAVKEGPIDLPSLSDEDETQRTVYVTQLMGTYCAGAAEP